MLPRLPRLSISPWLPNSLLSALSSLQGIVGRVQSAQRFPWNFFPFTDFPCTHVGFLQPRVNPLLGHHGTSSSLILVCVASPVCCIFSFTPSSELCSAFPYPSFPCGKSWAVGSAVPCAGLSGTIHAWHRVIPASPHRGHLAACPVSALAICTHYTLQKQKHKMLRLAFVAVDK